MSTSIIKSSPISFNGKEVNLTSKNFDIVLILDCFNCENLGDNKQTKLHEYFSVSLQRQKYFYNISESNLKKKNVN